MASPAPLPLTPEAKRGWQAEQAQTVRTKLLPDGIPEGLHIMVIGGMRGTGGKAQARCIQQSLTEYGIGSSSIDVGSFHCDGKAARCEACRPYLGVATSEH